MLYHCLIPLDPWLFTHSIKYVLFTDVSGGEWVMCGPLIFYGILPNFVVYLLGIIPNYRMQMCTITVNS